MVWWNIVSGTLLLFFGRRLFWLFVAVMGFMFGTQLAADFFSGLSDEAATLLAISIGLVCALLSIFLQRLMICVAGFLAGGYLAQTLALDLKYQAYEWLAFFGGGLFGLLLVNAVFDLALVLLSSLTGAALIMESLALKPPASSGVYVVLLVLGIITQSHHLAKSPPASKRSAT